MRHPEDQKADHAVAMDAPETEATPFRRRHHEAEPHAEPEGKEPEGLQEGESVHEPHRQRIAQAFPSAAGEIAQRGKGHELDVDDRDAEQGRKPQIIGHERTRRGGVVDHAGHPHAATRLTTAPVREGGAPAHPLPVKEAAGNPACRFPCDNRAGARPAPDAPGPRCGIAGRRVFGICGRQAAGRTRRARRGG